MSNSTIVPTQNLAMTIMQAAHAWAHEFRNNLHTADPELIDMLEKIAFDNGHRPLMETCTRIRFAKRRQDLIAARDGGVQNAIDSKMSGQSDQAEQQLADAHAATSALEQLDREEAAALGAKGARP